MTHITMITGNDRKGRYLRAGLLSVTMAFGVAAGAHGELPYHGEGHIMVTPDEMTWKPVGSMAEGARITVLEGDLGSKEPFTMRLKLPANYEIAPHIHPEYERVTVLSGTLHFAHGKEFDRDRTHALPVGSLAIMAPGDPMFGYTTEETVIQLHGNGPWGIEYLNPEDDPRN